MERLTEKRDGQNVIPLRQNGKIKWAICSAGLGDAPTKYLYGDHADLLASIEDILGDDYGLDRLREAVEKQAEYEQFMEKWKQVAEIAGAVKKVGAERAAELVEADREGRCVPIVRCRECKHWEDWGACGHTDNGFDSPPMGPDDFCSKGERSTD